MKKAAMILATLLIVSSMAACAGMNSGSGKSPSGALPQSSSTAAAESSKEESAAESEEESMEPSSEAESTEAASEEPEDSKAGVSMEEASGVSDEFREMLKRKFCEDENGIGSDLASIEFTFHDEYDPETGDGFIDIYNCDMESMEITPFFTMHSSFWIIEDGKIQIATVDGMPEYSIGFSDDGKAMTMTDSEGKSVTMYALD